MTAVIIGISSGLFIIVLFTFLKRFDKSIIYGLILCGIGFLYVGYTWTDTRAFIVNAVQAVFFTLFAYYGIKKNLYMLAAGFFLHGSWDLAYNLMPGPELLPPHYDLFCLAIDFTIGIYLAMFNYRTVSKHPLPVSPVK